MSGKYIKYFAFGSNMDLGMLGRMGVLYRNVLPAILEEYELVFSVPDLDKKDVGFASVQPLKGSVVKGLLMEIDEKSIEILDEYEAFPHDYLKQEITVKLLDNSLQDCFMYIAHPKVAKQGLKPWPGHWEIIQEVHKKYFK